MADTKADTDDRITKQQALGLVAMAIGVFIIANDFTSLSVALQAMEKTFDVHVATIQWVINGYAMVFGVLIVTGGRLADMFGRKKAFFIGTTIFAFFSLIGGLAPNDWVLLGCRALMGIGGALMWPAILGMTYELLPDSKAGLAGGIILGAAGFGNAAGPLLGGVLTDTVGWRWIFFLNVPIAIFGMFVTWKIIHEKHEPEKDHKIDYAGITVLTASLLALLLALDEGTSLGWFDIRIIGLFVVGALAMAGFVLVERRAVDRALIPRDVLHNGPFFAAAAATLLMSALFFAALIYLPHYMMKTLNYSAIQAGLGMLPMMGVFAATSFAAGPAYNRFGPKVVTSLGAAALAAGMFMLSAIAPDVPYTTLIPGMAVLGVGVGLFYSSITTAAITVVEKRRASLAGAIIYMCQIAGGSIGLGVNTAIVLSAAEQANGISTAFLVDGILATCGLVVVFLFVGGKVKVDVEIMKHRHRAHG